MTAPVDGLHDSRPTAGDDGEATICERGAQRAAGFVVGIVLLGPSGPEYGYRRADRRNPGCRIVGHAEQLVEAGFQGCYFGFQLTDAVTVTHVLAEVVEAVEPVVGGARHQDHGQGDERHRPQGHPVEMEDRPAETDRGCVAVAEYGGADAERKSKKQGTREHKTLPEVAQIGHPAKVTPLLAGWRTLTGG